MIQAISENGEPLPLSIRDCSGDGNLDISVPFSAIDSEQRSQILISENACSGKAPEQVHVRLSHGTPITLIAYDDSGNEVDTAKDISTSNLPLTLHLSSQTGIRMIEIIGSEICIQQICWVCNIDEGIGEIPEFDQCQQPGDFNKEPQEVNYADLGSIAIVPAVDQNGQNVALSIVDCDNSGTLDVMIPWTGESASKKAAINVFDTLCKEGLPKTLSITLGYSTQATFVARGENGTIVDRAQAQSIAGTSQQRVILSSSKGIQRVEMTGAEICITQICWNCQTAVTEQPDEPAREWVALQKGSEPGTPISVNVEDSNAEATVFHYQIPGFWMYTIEYGGEEFTRIEFPEAARLGGLGFEEKGNEWFQFPKETQYPRLKEDRYRNALAVRTRKPSFPITLDLQKNPQSGSQMEELGIDPSGARPGIPHLAGFLAVNPNAEKNKISLISDLVGTEEIELSAPLAPSGYSGLDQTKPPQTQLQNFIPPELIDREFYDLIPENYTGDIDPLSNISHSGAFGIVEARVPLVTYQSSKRIAIHTEMTVKVNHTPGIHDGALGERAKQIGWDAWVQKPAVINGWAFRERLRDFDLPIRPLRTANYLILTPDEYRSDLQEFINWKQSKGLSVAVYTVGNNSTDDIAPDRDSIDTFLEDYYGDRFWRTLYVLIVGDENVIPAGRTNRIVAGPDGSNGDSDQVYEVIGNDRFASLYVGRLSVNSSQELNTQLDKILAYERGEIFGNWPTKASLLANSENDDGSRGVSSAHPSKYAAAVNDIANYGSYTDPPSFEVFHAGADDLSDVRATNDDVIEAINKGRGQVLYRGHGGGTNWVAGWDGSGSWGDAFDQGDELTQLKNKVFPIVYSIACVNNRILLNDSFGESWMSMEGAGSVAFWSTSVNSYTVENHNRAKGVFRAIYESDITHLGAALAEAERLSWNLTGSSNQWDNNTFCYLLLGDPEMTIRRESVPFDLSFNVDLERIQEQTVVRVLDQNQTPLSGTLISLITDDEQRHTGYTSSKGTLLLDFPPESILDINLFPDGFPWFDFDIEDLLPPLAPPTPNPIWVDDDNTSGVEDGSEFHPYNTIAEAMNVAVTHTIRVREGTYNENVTMKDGVELIGAGAENTIIDAGGSNPVISCTNVGSNSVIRGFTLRNGSVGVLCTSSSPEISETIISNIALSQTSGDGIRVDDSSPDINHNVIAGVGGMGIRAQGNSEPRIVNNTIFDMRYYAGISFASTNIGSVSPLIKNNIIMRGNDQPVSGILWSTPATPQLSYNNVYDVANANGADGKYAFNDGTNWNAASGGPGAISVDPLFVGEGSGSYTYNGSFNLNPISPCIDVGDPAPQYNDVDGSRNDMGAYGGLRRDPGSGSHSGNGFLFTSVGRIPVSQIDQNSSSDTYGLADVSSNAASDFHIPQYNDAPFGGNLWLRGLFGSGDPVDYYKIIATPLGEGDPIVLNDALTKTKFTVNPDGSVDRTRVRLGPLTIGSESNLYKLNKEGTWSQQDLRMIWRTSGLTGKYTLTYEAYQQTGPNSVSEVSLSDNTLDTLVLWLDNSNLNVQINEVLYADGSGLVECEDITFPHNGSEQLIFDITANHPNGFLRTVRLHARWGDNHFGGEFLDEQYTGMNDSSPPTWSGFANEQLPPLLPRDNSGNVVPWEDCAYEFRIVATARTTDGFHYLHRSDYSVHHAVGTGGTASSATAKGCIECEDDGKTYPIATPLARLDPPTRPEIPSPSKQSSEQSSNTVLPQAIGDNPEDFVATWINTNPNTGGITRILIDQELGSMRVHAYGQCIPSDCDWGEIAVPFTGNPFQAVYTFDFKTTTLTLELINNNTLSVQSVNVFNDGTERDYTATYTFERKTIWVDDDNDSGTEDGSRANPYNTIMEGINAASAGYTVRVLPGEYPEAVTMKAGVNLIGSGADSTIIRPGLSNTGIYCDTIGSNVILSGFTITEANLGIYCLASNLTIRENNILDLRKDTPSADGIRLDDSSPTIENNLIAHVGGMGLRAQGNSEPMIINNTFYDYEYYAAISFAANDIGAVAPTVMNNIIVRGNDEAVAGVLWASPATVKVSYNNVYNIANTTSTGGYYAVSQGGTWNEVSGGTGALRVDPEFVDADNDAFQLSTGSPCIDAGNPAALYNDLDGSRNDMGSFGGQRLEIGESEHGGSGFVFTSIGKVPITEIVSDNTSPSHGLLQVSAETADDLNIPQFNDAAFGGRLFIRGLFGNNDKVDYYQILYTPTGSGNTPTPMNDALNKVKYTINPDGTVDHTRIQMGPQTVGGVSNLYLLNKSGYWSHTDLRMAWNTTGLKGKYDVTVKAYQQNSDGSISEVSLPNNELNHFTLRINNTPVEANIEAVAYADGTTIGECGKIILPHNGDNRLVFTITAQHPDGFLHNVRFDSFWGNNRFGGYLLRDNYSNNDGSPPTWAGYTNQTLSPLQPKDADGNILGWNTCPYRFRLITRARITNGVHYIERSSDILLHSIITGATEATPTPTPEQTPVQTPQPAPTYTPTPGIQPTPTDTPTPTPTPMLQPTPTPTPTVQHIFIYDEPGDTSGDWTDQTDFDAIDNRNITISTDAPQNGATNWHVYVKKGFGGMRFLGATVSGSDRSFEWNENSQFVDQKFSNGPDFNSVYKFRMIRIDDDLGPDDIFDMNGTVGFNAQGGNPVPLVQSANPGVKEKQIYIVDDLLGLENLAPMGRAGTDTDPANWRALQIAWNFGVDPDTVNEYHILVSVDQQPFEFMGQTVSGQINYFWWTSIDNFRTINKFANGPEDGHTYRFKIVLIPFVGQRQSLSSGTLTYEVE